VEVHFYSGDYSCITSNGIHYVDFCNVNWVETGNQWAALIYDGGDYQPGMPPGTYWDNGSCISRVDVNT
jgi:hypothetical protein